MSNWFSDWLAGNGSGNAAGSGDYGTTLDWVKFLTQYNQSQKSPVVRNVPQSPEQKQLFNFALGRVQGLPDSSQSVFPQAIKNAYTTPSFDIAAAKRGDVAYSHGTPDPAALARIMVPQPSGWGGAPTPTGPTGGLPGGATGSPSQPIGAGGTFPGLAGYPGQAGTGPEGSAPTPSNTSGAEFKNFVQTYGKAAGEAVLALIQQNPYMAVKAAIDAVRAHIGSQPQNLPSSGQNYPSNVLTPRPDPFGSLNNMPNAPTDPRAPGENPFMNTPQIPWGDYRGNPPQKPQPVDWGKYYDPMGGAGAIAGLLGAQMSDGGDGKGPKKF